MASKLRGNRLLRRLDTWGGRPAILALAPFSRRGVEAVVPAAPASILVVKLPSIGDTVLLTPTLRALRRRYPAARIGLLGTAGNAGLATELPWIDSFHCLDPNRAVREPRYFFRFVREIAAGGWEVAVDAEQWTLISPLLIRLAGIPVRIGFRTPDRVRHVVYTHTRPRMREAHESRNFFRLLEPLGIGGEPGRPELEVPARRAGEARARLQAAGWDGRDPVVLIHPGCGHAHARAWPAERYAEMCARLRADQHPFFALTGTGGEATLVEALAGSIGDGCGSFTSLAVPDFIAMVEAADVVVSGNTGAMHVAAALGKQQVVLEGPNDPAKWGPINERARIIHSSCPDCPCLDFGWEFHRTDGYCMEQISVDAATSAVDEAIRASLVPAEGGPRSRSLVGQESG
jgi:heptosyltransferase I